MSYFMFPFLILLILLSVSISGCKKSDKNLEKVEQGTMSKVTYQGHTYVVWSINMGGGLVHDPDCICQNNKSLPKQKEEIE